MAAGRRTPDRMREITIWHSYATSGNARMAPPGSDATYLTLKGSVSVPSVGRATGKIKTAAENQAPSHNQAKV